MTIPMFQVDAFTSAPFSGNPAAVCLLPEAMSDTTMQQIATEMNLSETAFLVPADGAFDLRWFTPLVEVDLCGHATLASAHVLWSEGDKPRDSKLRFMTRSGELVARSRGKQIELDFPARRDEAVPSPDGLAQALGAEPEYVGRNVDDLIVLFDSEETVRGLRPDFGALVKVTARGIIATARSTEPDYDFVSRFFAPAVGIDEDPVTGSAHCCLAPFWQQRLGKAEMCGFQASLRGGVVGVEVLDDRVRLIGEAVTVLRGQLLM